LESLTFEDNTFDLFITQDVFEHIFNPNLAAQEIMRVLKPGGVHVFTAPKHKGLSKSHPRALLEDGKIKYLMEESYHGNPVGDGRALVTWDYGDDFEHLIFNWTKAATTTYVTRDRELGIDGEYLEVFVTRKIIPYFVSCAPSKNPIKTINERHVSRVFEFNALGDTEGWDIAGDASLEATGGSLKVAVKGRDPHIISSGTLNIDAASCGDMIIRMRAKGVVAGDAGQVFWSTSPSPDFTEALSYGFPLGSSGTWQTYVLKLSDNPGWKGTVQRIRFDPCFKSPNPTFEIDSIRFQSTPSS
jgi:hypothetical protein